MPLRLLILIAALAMAWGLGDTPLLDADEGRNGEVAREMAETNDYVMPRYDGMPYLDKPIVYFAAAAGVMEILGPSELAARLPSLLFTWATAALLFWFVRRVWDDRLALTATAIFLSMPLVIAFARIVIFDSALTFFIVLAIIAFYLAVEEESRRWSVLAWAAMAAGVLTKGPVAILLPLLIAIPYAIQRKRFGRLWSWIGLVAFVAILAPWLWAVTQVVPDFLSYVLVTETAARLATKELQRTGPPWYFLPYVIGGALPWSIVAACGLGRRREAETATSQAGPEEPERSDAPATPKTTLPHALRFVILWLVLPFLFFSISQSKRPQYILPVMPAVAILAALVWYRTRQVLATRIAAAVYAFFGLALVAAPFLRAAQKLRPEIGGPARTAAFIIGGLTLLSAVLAFLFVRRKELALAALMLPLVAIPMTTSSVLHGISERRSAKSFVARLQPWLTPQTEIIGYEAFTGSMAFYLRRPIIVATDDASEFTSNYILRRYDRFVSDPASPVRRSQWVESDLKSCCRRRIYIARIKDRQHTLLLELRGLRPIVTGAHHVAYGPYTGPPVQ